MSRKLSCFLTALLLISNASAETPPNPYKHHLWLKDQPGFFRFSFDDVKMPMKIQNMGLLGVTYLADISPIVYAGAGAYGSVTGSQGGLFVLGLAGGLHKQFLPHFWADAGLFIGGGGGRSSLVGGGLMLRPYAGLAYDFDWARLGIHYSYIDFPTGEIHSQQVGLNLDLPFDFYYVKSQDACRCLFDFDYIRLLKNQFLIFQRNDFSILLQAYKQRTGTKNVLGATQDGTIGLVGFELDHYITKHAFWWLKTSGAFRGIPNGYMDVLAGLGYHWSPFGSHRVALVPQLGAGAGGGGNLDSGGGILVYPQLGLEVPLTNKFAARISGGYLWSPKGQMRAVTGTGSLIYHLDMAAASPVPRNYLADCFTIQDWRIQVFNQTYLHPQRAHTSINTAINLIAVQIDQLFNPIFFFSYQGASAYQGYNAGGYATGMIGPGMQTSNYFYNRLQFYSEVLVGAGGGGGLALGGGSLIEPVVGMRFALTPAIKLSASANEIKALRNNLNTFAFNVGISFNFGTLNR